MLFGFGLIACSENIELSESEDIGTIKNIDQELECSCDSLELSADSSMLYNDTLFTGKCFMNYRNTGDKYVEKHYLSGKLHGKILYYDKEGEIIAEEEYSNGVNTVSATESFVPCDCSELRLEKGANGLPNKKYKKTLPYTGVCYEYYPGTEDVYMELNYQKGLLHGYCKYYDKEGNQLYMEEYNKGVLEAVIN